MTCVCFACEQRVVLFKLSMLWSQNVPPKGSKLNDSGIEYVREWAASVASQNLPLLTDGNAS